MYLIIIWAYPLAPWSRFILGTPIFFGLIGSLLLAQPDTLYFSPKGKDLNPGTRSAPKRSLAFLADLPPGTVVLLEAGQVHHGMLQLNTAITVDRYGLGADPIVVHLKPAHEASTSFAPSCLLQETTLQEIPKATFPYPADLRTYPGKPNQGGRQFTDSGLPRDIIGGRLIIRSNIWDLSEARITDYDGQTVTMDQNINFTPLSYAHTAYVLTDHPSLLQPETWVWHRQRVAYQGAAKQLLVPASDPHPHPYGTDTVWQTHRITSDGVTLRYLHFKGAQDCFFMLENQGITFEGCTFEFGANRGALYALNADDLVVRACTLQDLNQAGLFLITCERYELTDNVVRRVDRLGYLSGGPYTMTGIYASQNANRADVGSYMGGLIARNHITRVGWAGIRLDLGDEGVRIEDNVVENFCTVKLDGGGIYTWRHAWTPGPGSAVILRNLIRHPNSTYTPYINSHVPVMGIYLDDRSQGVEVRCNRIVGDERLVSHLFLHNVQDVTVKHNRFEGLALRAAALLVSDGAGTLHEGGLFPMRRVHFQHNDFSMVEGISYAAEEWQTDESPNVFWGQMGPNQYPSVFSAFWRNSQLQGEFLAFPAWQAQTQDISKKVSISCLPDH